MSDHLPNNLTPRAHQVFALARKEAARLRVNWIDTEHILLGLMKLCQGSAVNVLKKCGIDYESLSVVTEKRVGIGSSSQKSQIPYSPRVKKVIDFSIKEAKSCSHSYVGTDHIFLALLREGGGNAIRVLREDFSLDVDNLRAQVLRDFDPAVKDELKTSPFHIHGFSERLIAIFDWDITDLGKSAIEAADMTMRAAIGELRHMRPHEADRPRVLAAVDRALVTATTLDLVVALAEGYKHLLGDEAGVHLRKLVVERSFTESPQRNIGTALQVLNDGKPVSFEIDFIRKWKEKP